MKMKFRIYFTIQKPLLFIQKALNHLPYSFVKPFVLLNNKIRVNIADSILNYVVLESKALDKYNTGYIQPKNKIGNKVWMFWYSGYEEAPPLIKKCIERTQSISNIEFHLITKNNLPQGLLDEFYIKGTSITDALNNKTISIQQFSDILRHYLLLNYGGFWIDATIFTIDKSFFIRNGKKTFYTIKYKQSSFFNEGLFSSFLIGCGKNDLFISMSYNIWKSYYKVFSKPFDYFMIDFIWYYVYRHLGGGDMQVKKEIDSLPYCNEVYNVWDIANCRNEDNENKFYTLLNRNSIQKITYKDKKTLKALNNPSSMYGRLLTYENSDGGAKKQ